MKKIFIIAPQVIVTFVSILVILIYSPLKSIEGITKKKIKEKDVIKRETAVPILLYHNIDGKGPYSVSKEQIQEHFEFYKQNEVRVISLKTLLEHIDKKKPFKSKVMVITFDDGYPSSYSILKPLAEEYKYPITLFVYIKAIYDRGKKAITWGKLKKMDSGYIDIQCHSFSHYDLVKGLNEGKRHLVYKELVTAKKIIEMKLSKKVEYFAFPYGRYSLETLELARGAGYSRVFSTDGGLNIITRDNYCLRRHHILSSYSMEDFEAIVK